MVGAVRFELTTSCTRNKRASQATLRPEPEKLKVPLDGRFGNSNLKTSGQLRSDLIGRLQAFQPKIPLETGSRG